MKRLGDFTAILLMAAAFFFTIHTFDAASGSEPDYDGPVQQIIVYDGDNLWNIASRFSSHSSLTIEEAVEWIAITNDLEGALVKPGQTLDVPVGGSGVAME